MANIRIGISGWTYPPWRTIFFPPGLRQRDELGYASRQVRSIEINGTFYSLQRPSSYRSWHAQTPDDFVFSVKGPRFLTHIRRLEDPVPPLANFFASGVLELREKLGPFLWQLPPSLEFDARRLAGFFRALPRTRRAAAKLAVQHDAKVKDVAIDAGPDRPLRHALEVRHPSFVQPGFIDLLREHGIALVVADTAGKWPQLWDTTADFVYARLHGDAALYVSGYTPKALDHWARDVRRWSGGGSVARARLLAAPAEHTARDVFVYFDNDVKVRAPFDAMSLAHRLGLGPAPGRPPNPAEIAEAPRPARTSWLRRSVRREPRKAAGAARRPVHTSLVQRANHQRKKRS